MTGMEDEVGDLADVDGLTRQWLRGVLMWHVDKLDSGARQEREVDGPAARLLAEAHSEAALVYRRALRRLDAAEGNTDELCTDPACACHGGRVLRCL